MQKSLARMADMLLKINDRSRSSKERLTQSIEKQAAAYGKTGVDRLIADRDRLIKKLGDEQGPTASVTAAYAKIIDVESGKSGGSFPRLCRSERRPDSAREQLAGEAVWRVAEGPAGAAGHSAGASRAGAGGASGGGGLSRTGEVRAKRCL